MKISIGYEFEYQDMSFCLINTAKTIYNPPTSKPKTFLQEDGETLLQVSGDFIDALYENSSQLQTIQKTFYSSVTSFLESHKFAPDKYKIQLANGEEFWLKNTSENYTFKSAFRSAEFDYLYKEIYEIDKYLKENALFSDKEINEMSESMKLFLIISLEFEKAHEKVLEYVKNNYNGIPIQNTNFPFYKFAFLPKTKNPGHLFLAKYPIEQFQKFYFAPQFTLGIHINETIKVFKELADITSEQAKTNYYKVKFTKIYIETLNLYYNIIKLQHSETYEFLENYIFLFLWSFYHFGNRKYNSYIIVRHRFSDFKLLFPENVIEMLFNLLNDKQKTYFQSIHKPDLSEEQATILQNNEHIHLYPFQENRILIEYRIFYEWEIVHLYLKDLQVF